MARYDLSNISGATLAKIGKALLEETHGVIPVKSEVKMKPADYTSLDWLDRRIKEVCDKGKI